MAINSKISWTIAPFMTHNFMDDVDDCWKAYMNKNDYYEKSSFLEFLFM